MLSIPNQPSTVLTMPAPGLKAVMTIPAMITELTKCGK